MQPLYLRIEKLLAFMLMLVIALPALAQNIVIGYQTIPEPSKVAQFDGIYEKLSHEKIDWRKFDSGSDLIQAIASGSIDIGYVGSSPIAAAISSKLPVKLFLITTQLGSTEALVARNGSNINVPADLYGKKIGVPFVSTSHYGLIQALKYWQLEPNKIQILNLSPPAIIAAWKQGNIDATFVWDPALGVAKDTGKVLISYQELAKIGAVSFDGWLVHNKFAAKKPEFVKIFAKVTLAEIDKYQKNPEQWRKNSANIQKIAQITGARAADIPNILAGNYFPPTAAQKDYLNNKSIGYLTRTLAFLKEQGKSVELNINLANFITAEFLPQ